MPPHPGPHESNAIPISEIVDGHSISIHFSGLDELPECLANSWIVPLLIRVQVSVEDAASNP